MKTKFVLLVLLMLSFVQFALAAPQCTELFDSLPVGQTSFNRPIEVSHEKVLDKEFDIVRFPRLSPIKKYYSFDVTLKDFFKMSFGEIFMKFIRTSVINDYVVSKYKLQDIVKPMGNDIMIGFDRNHTYLLLYDAKTGKYTRADSGTDAEFTIITDAKNVNSGIFLRFANVSDQHLQDVQSFVTNKNRYMTCTHGVCSALSKINIDFGTKNEPIETTYELIDHLIKREIHIEDPDVRFDIFSVDPRPLDVQVTEAIQLSKVNEQIRKKDFQSFVIVARSLSQTFTYWFFFKVGLMPKL